MKFFNVCSKRVWKGKDGKENVKWLNCGTLKIMDDGKTFLELNMFPGTPFYCFPPKEKEESPNFGG